MNQYTLTIGKGAHGAPLHHIATEGTGDGEAIRIAVKILNQEHAADFGVTSAWLTRSHHGVVSFVAKLRRAGVGAWYRMPRDEGPATTCADCDRLTARVKKLEAERDALREILR